MNPANLGPCACTQIRRTARRITSFYDEFLSSAGLTITQYAILAKIGRAETLSHTELAGLMGMDRTTLTRNLRPLEQAKFLISFTGQDRRQRLLCLSAHGEHKLQQSQPLWADAQRTFTAQFGSAALHELQQLLSAAEAAAAA
jgi:DNA-binding MarR family transcriptional regulator